MRKRKKGKKEKRGGGKTTRKKKTGKKERKREKERKERKEKEEKERQERKEKEKRREKRKEEERQKEKERKERKERESKERKEKEEEKEKRRKEIEKKGDEVVDMWIKESGLSSSRLASRIGKIVCDGDLSSRAESSSSKKIGDVDEEMDDVEEGLKKDALSSTLRGGSSSKAGTSRQPPGALEKEVETTESGTDAYDFPDYTPNASDYDSERDGVVDSCEDRRLRQRMKSAGGSFKTKNKDVVVNLMSAFMNSL